MTDPIKKRSQVQPFTVSDQTHKNRYDVSQAAKESPIISQEPQKLSRLHCTGKTVSEIKRVLDEKGFISMFMRYVRIPIRV